MTTSNQVELREALEGARFYVNECRFGGTLTEKGHAECADVLAKIDKALATIRDTDEDAEIVANYSDHFLVAYVSQDGKQVGIDHPTEADWSEVLRAHVSLRDRLNERIAEQDKCPLRLASSTPAEPDEPTEATGTMECPYCGKDTPHHHKPADIAKMVPGLAPRLAALAEELNRVDVYSSMHRVYGTDYSRKAELALQRDLRQSVKAMSQRKAEPDASGERK